MQTLDLKQELMEAETRNTDLYKVKSPAISLFCCPGGVWAWLIPTEHR